MKQDRRDDSSARTIRLCTDIGDLSPAEWDACAGADNPFLSHAFLAALERSGCTAPETGWAPHHLLLQDPDGSLVGAVPAYLKGNSFGEYVFDHSWAHAFERAGGDYYPKLQVCVPFTPATGPRLLVRPDQPHAETANLLSLGLMEAGRQLGISSVHVTFAERREWELMAEAGFLQRTGEQFHWENRGFASFDAFLAALSSRKRKAIRKERREALADDIEIFRLTGAALETEHWDAFYAFYMDTGSRKWGRPYLNRQFFALLHETMADRVMLVMARRRGRWIAGALNLIGGTALYGRNWGCLEHHRFLHFECCYYQAIDFAIERGLARVEAGAQGEHKLARGYLPVTTYSAHWIADPGFRQAVAQFLGQERRQVDQEIAWLSQHSPFRIEPEAPPPEEPE
ncbi:MAG: GNAT family N-acetyltransferase [Sneathiellaceae bacterium]